MTKEALKDFDYKFWNSPLDEEEQWYEEHSDEFVPVENQEEMREKLMEAAKNTMKEIENKKMVTMRLEGNDIARLKDEAKRQGLPYQSLLGSILHKYLDGTLVDISEAKKVLSFQVK